MKNDVDNLEDERRRIEMEKQLLLNEKDQETEAWKTRYQEMTKRNEEIICNLTDANKCYLHQVADNEKLQVQIEELQTQHRDMISKFREIEFKLHQSEKQVEEQKI